ncbi:MAG: excinuclease ABC subunit UvrC [Acidobacteria bacterium]|nr:excinuclease ABC subunit UvrC [Acidobacteriota bacterium]
MPIEDLKEQIARLPEQPGVYLWRNAAGETIYVGKARALRDRVRSYLAAAGLSPRHDALLQEIAAVEVIVTDSVMEALALENNLIKQRRPKYNILLRDDKSYPYLQLTTSEAFPRLQVARRVEKGGDFFAGPFLPAKLARRSMALAHRLFGIRSCNEVITGGRGRPCLEYDIKRCIAPCVREICTPEQYGAAVANTRLLLEGRNDELIATLRDRMAAAAGAERFEEAAQLRDALRTVQILRDRQQKVATAQLGDRDVIGLKVGPSGGAIQVFAMRGGRVVERVELATEPFDSAQGRPFDSAQGRPFDEAPFDDTQGRPCDDAHGRPGAAPDADVLQAALQQFYELRVPPAEIHLPLGIEEAEAIETWLSSRAGRRVRIVVPQRGDKRALVELATRNAELSYRTRFNEATAAHFDALETLRGVLGLAALPRRIECFDISTIQGSETVASMVVCEDGRMKKGEYRKYRVRGSPLPDDFSAMREVVRRRYQKVMAEGGPFPDLILIDGGKGQLSAAYDALERIGLGTLVAAGIAKKEELLVTRDSPEPIVFADHDPALLLVQRIRDEAHRFAVTFHRKARTMRDLRSELDAVPGIGPRRRRALLTAFGSVAGVRRATREELDAVVGPKTAAAVIDYFAKSL